MFLVLVHVITKTHLYNLDPLKPHFYIENWGLQGVYIIFLISALKHRCFGQKYENYQNLKTFGFLFVCFFFSCFFFFLLLKFSIYLNRRVFVMCGACVVLICFVPHLFFFWCLRRAVLRDSEESSLTFVDVILFYFFYFFFCLFFFFCCCFFLLFFFCLFVCLFFFVFFFFFFFVE